jgi:hypothetical protein
MCRITDAIVQNKRKLGRRYYAPKLTLLYACVFATSFGKARGNPDRVIVSTGYSQGAGHAAWLNSSSEIIAYPIQIIPPKNLSRHCVSCCQSRII